MRTPLCDELGIEFPIFAFTHCRDVVVAVSKAGGFGVLGAVGVIQTIPSIALLAFLIAIVGSIGLVPALLALFAYALLPIVRNTHTGLHEVPVGLGQAALSLGLNDRQTLRWVQLPLAMPTLLAGIKTAAVINVGTATLAAFVGAGGFGERIVWGLAINDRDAMLAGALPAAGGPRPGRTHLHGAGSCPGSHH